jgi:hypothetical protein
LAGTPRYVCEGATQTYFDLSFVKKQKIQAINSRKNDKKCMQGNPLGKRLIGRPGMMID